MIQLKIAELTLSNNHLFYCLAEKKQIS